MAKRKDRTLLLPTITSETVELSNGDGMTFRKKILPLGSINYEGRKLTFDESYLGDLVKSFTEQAYDAPPFQLADASNAHNMDPERTRGHLIGLSREEAADTDGPGLYATIRMHSRKAAKLVTRYPLGVSAQIREGLVKADGRQYPRAIRHVLGTMDPRVSKLGTWRAVSLSTDDTGKVIDLTSAEYEESTVAKNKGKDKGTQVLDVDLSEFEDAAEQIDLSDDEADALVAEVLADLSDDDLGVESDPMADQGTLNLSDAGDSYTGDVSLAAQLDEQRQATRAIRSQLAAAQWETEATRLSQAGVPKAAIDLATPLMESQESGVVNLSDADGQPARVDAKAIVRELLNGFKGMIDLSEPKGLAAGGDSDDQTEQMLAMWDQQSGTVR